MRQIIQDLATGATTLADLPRPVVPPGGVLIRTRMSLLSAGTERMLVDFGRAGWLSKARQQPEKVQQVLNKMRTDGVLQTIDAVRSKLEQPIPLGYCNAGVIVETRCRELQVGDRVASNGAHAELVAVPRNLCARIPDSVSDETAAFTVIGSIGLQGMRLARPRLGECFVVTGLGLIGLMTVQLLRANGCRVLGIDFDDSKLTLARDLGASTVNAADTDQVLATADSFSRGRGVDGVLLTAATTSSDPVAQAAHMCRKRGRIVLVGVVGLELNRSDFFEKELTFQVSCSYGPGRYDQAYEQDGQDYPVGFVRWTEQRNFEAVLDMMADARLGTDSLVSHRFAFGDAPRAYDLLSSNEPSLGILLKYDDKNEWSAPRIVLSRSDSLSDRSMDRSATGPVSRSTPVVGVIGAGNYAGRVLMPAFQKAGARLLALANRGGPSAAHYGARFGFEEITTDVTSLLHDDRVNTVVIATRHDSHARYACEALRAGKHVFCEKPICLTTAQLNEIRSAWEEVGGKSGSPQLMVGFNRRFAPLIAIVSRLLAEVRAPRAFVMTVNAGAIPPDHWTQDPDVGGGRVVGEACHFIDLLRYLAGSPIVSHEATYLSAPARDTTTIDLRFADGSIGSVHYFANGSKSLPKERLEIFTNGRTMVLDNFRRLHVYGWSRVRARRLWRQDKGQRACVEAFVGALTSRAPSPIPFEEILEVARISIDVADNPGA
jgi:predicted dehydrogenase/threonine dehydrogenase-like Zn-dependent dehydrogenase